jgi:hypothetical protein
MPGDIVVGLKKPKKAKRVTGGKAEAKALRELQDINRQIGVREKQLDLRFETSRKLFERRRKLQEQLGI